MARREELRIQLPGEEFLQCRLTRAAAVPPEQRTPEVAAFVAYMELRQQLAALLPLTVDGEAALPLDSEATRHKLLLARLAVVHVSHSCPSEPPGLDAEGAKRCSPYDAAWAQLLAGQLSAPASGGSRGGSSVGGGGGRRSGGDIGVATLAKYLHLIRAGNDAFCKGDYKPSIREMSAASACLALPRAAAAAAACLQRLQRYQRHAVPAHAQVPLPTVQELQSYARICMLGSIAMHRLVTAVTVGTATAASERGELRRLAEGAISDLLRLYPDRPRTHSEVCNVLTTLDDLARAMQHELRAIQLGQQQGSDLAVASAMGFVYRSALAVALSGSDAEQSMARTAAELFPAARAALRRCKRLLPEFWVHKQLVLLPRANLGFRVCQALLSMVELAAAGGGGEAVQQARAEVLALRQELEGLAVEKREEAMRSGPLNCMMGSCHGCGVEAAGLRSCSRCRTARYCSRACQASHWPQHKAECRCDS